MAWVGLSVEGAIMKSSCESPGAYAKTRDTSSTLVTSDNRVLVGDALAAIGREMGAWPLGG